MILERLSQAAALINKAKKLAVIFKKDITGDNLAAALALNLALRKLNKSIETIGQGNAGEQFGFLPQTKLIKNDFTKEGGTLIVKIKKAKNKLNEFWYEDEGDDVKVFINAKKNYLFNEEDVDIKVDYEGFDVLLTVGVQSLHNLGELYEKNTGLFFNTPVINIDNNPVNENYGELNLIDLKSPTLSEIVFELLEVMNLKFNSDIATLLLAGLIGKTDSFQGLRIRPQTFFIASKLMTLGADHQEIIKNLYKTKTFSLLKLWGRSLAGLKAFPELGLIVSRVNRSDFEHSGAGEAEFNLVFKELISSLSDARIVVMLAEIGAEDMRGFVYVKPPLDLDDLLKELGAVRVNGHIGNFEFKEKNLDAAMENIKIKIQNWLKSVS